jgi:hypothetical protein
VAVSARVLACVIAALAVSAPAAAQSIAVEGTHSAGASSEELTALGTQLRVFGDAGETLRGLRFQIEGTWGWRSDEQGDFFGTSYPYGGKVDLMEAYAEYVVERSGPIRAVKGGRYRTPFGIHASSDHAYVGFLRAPLIRYGTYYALSNHYLEQGASLVVGRPRFTVEGSIGAPSDVGEAIRRPGVSGVVRSQAAVGSWIVGASYLDTTPYLPARFASGRARFGGVDVRWMSNGILVRGEWIGGQPFEGTRTTGGYADLLIHRPMMGPVTAFARAERLAYDANPPHALYTHRYTTGARIRLWRTLALSAGVAHQAGQLTQRRRTAFDLGISGSWRRAM